MKRQFNCLKFRTQHSVNIADQCNDLATGSSISQYKKTNYFQIKSIFKIASFLTVAILLYSPILALAGGPGFGGNVDDGGGACAVPLDGGLSLLIAAGVGYGAKKFTANKKRKKHIVHS